MLIRKEDGTDIKVPVLSEKKDEQGDTEYQVDHEDLPLKCLFHVAIYYEGPNETEDLFYWRDLDYKMIKGSLKEFIAFCDNIFNDAKNTSQG